MSFSGNPAASAALMSTMPAPPGPAVTIESVDLGLSGKACIVTGGSRGIGLEVARQLGEEGAGVLLVGRGEQALRAGAQQCAGEVAWHVLDVTAPDAGTSAVRACQERFGSVDILVNNAGTSSVRDIEQLTDEEWQAQWDIHVMAPMRLMRASIPLMLQRGWGRIVNVSSSSGKRPGQRNVAYSVTKAAELSLSRAYADAYASHGVLVNAVTPGPVGSELWLAEGGLADQTAQARGISRDQVLAAAAKSVPLGRLAQADEIASVIVFLCSERASNVAGAAWSVDGGAVPVIL
jgi:3-oxoacyl-[acyl-carrier protein] reductase